MIFRVTRSVFARYGRPAIIFSAITGPMPGRESRSSALALLMSIRPPFLLDVVDPVFPVGDFVEELVWAAASVTAVKTTSNHRLTFIKAILAARSAHGCTTYVMGESPDPPQALAKQQSSPPRALCRES